MVFANKPYRPQTDGFAGWANRMTPAVRKHPFLLYGLPFTLIVVGASFAITPFTRERYERAAKRITNVTKEEDLKLQASRRKVDLREEYYRLQAKVGDEQEEWEPVRVQRPAGAKEWGEGYTNTATPEEAERLLRYERMTPEAIAERKRANAKRFADDHALREQLAQDKDTKHSKGWLQWMGIRASSVIEPEGTAAAHRRLVVFAPTEPGERASNSESGSESGRDPHAGVGPEGYTRRADGVIIGPDGKPCRACNSKVMFSSAMKGFGLGGSGKATGMGTRTGAQGLKIENDACPPDGPAIGAATWTFLHSAAAVYPDDPDAEQAEAMRNLIRALAVLYPCAPCAYGLRSHIEAQEAARAVDATKRLTPPNLLAGAAADPGTLPEAVLSGRAVRAWLCAAHNEVNSRTGKPLFACTEAALNKRWGDGPEDGSCDV